MAEKNIYAKKTADRVIILSDNHKFLLTLNPTASFLWNLCSQPILISSLAKNIAVAFRVSEEVALRDVMEFVKYCLHERILKRVT